MLGPGQLRAYKASELAAGALATSTLVANLPAGTTGTGLALFPKSGEALVTTIGGRVLVIGRLGAVQNPDFVTGIGQGVNAAIGNIVPTGDDPANGAEVFITANSSGRVIRYLAKRSGGKLVADPGVPAQVLSDRESRHTASAMRRSPTPPGRARATTCWSTLSVGYDLTFEKVNISGFSASRTYLIEQSQVPGGVLQGSLVGLPDGFTRTIPSYVGCFTRSVGPAGLCYYLVSVAETSADVFGATQQHHFEEAPFALQVGSCEDNPEQPRLFHATDDDDPAVPEGPVFADITAGCGSHIGRGGQFSLFLTGSDGRPLAEIVNDKFANFASALNGTDVLAGGLAPFIKKNTKGSLSRDLDRAITAWNDGDEAEAQSRLAAMVATVKSSLSSFSRCSGGVCRNSPGEIIARAESASFMVCQAGGGSAHDCGRELN